MKRVLSLAAILFTIIVGPLAAQEFGPLEPRESVTLYKDGERWIRERFRWFLEERSTPDGIPEGARESAWSQARAMSVHRPRVPLSKTGATAASTWTNIGPSNIGGRITGIAIHPTNPDIVWFTGADGGVWKSTNGGANYTPVSDDLPTLAMGSIAVDPNNPTTIWVGTGEANGSGDCYPGVGVVVSRDNGATWAISGSKPASNIARMLVDVSDSRIILCASRTGLFRSTNAGSTWVSVLSGFVSDVTQDTSAPAIMYVGVQGSGVQKSTDHGATWSLLPTGLPKDSTGRVGISLCRQHPSVIWSVAVSSKGSGLLAVVKSTDGGATWTRTPKASTPNFFGSQGWYNIAIAADPVNPDIVLVGGVGLYRTTNGGTAWSSVASLHVDQHALEYSRSNPSIVYAGNDGGIYKSTNGGASFVSQNVNLPITQFYELGVALQAPTKMVGGTQDNGSKRRATASSIWLTATGGDGGYAIIDYTDTSIIYTEYQNGSHNRTTDGGKSWTSINKGLYGSSPWVTPVMIHPTDPAVLFTCTNRQFYKTTNRGTQWFPFHGSMDSSSTIKSMTIAQADPRIMLLGYTSGKVWKTTDAGATWRLANTGLPTGNVTDVLINPLNTQVHYCTYSGYSTNSVFKTIDGGTRWFSIAGNLPAVPKNAIEINPRDTSQLFVGTDFGVYTTTDGGATWQILGDGMPKVVVVDLELHPTGLLRAATHGRSIYELAVTIPVELASFTAEPMGHAALLRWRTITETNNSGFVVQRREAATWVDVAFVPGQGSTLATHDYEYLDESGTRTGRVWYRLRQVDHDGTHEESPEVAVDFTGVSDGGFVLDQNFPNPCAPVSTVVFRIPGAATAGILLTDAAGRTVREIAVTDRVAGAHAVHIDATPLSAGTYFYHLLVDGVVRQTRCMVVLH